VIFSILNNVFKPDQKFSPFIFFIPAGICTGSQVPGGLLLSTDCPVTIYFDCFQQ
jgi:hypothetical protein